MPHGDDQLTVSDTDAAREFSPKERKNASQKGQAKPDGGFPIKSEQDLRNAIRAFGRASDKEATKRHIIKRARALGLTKLLPSNWGVDSASTGGAMKIKPKGNQFCIYDGSKEISCFPNRGAAIGGLRKLNGDKADWASGTRLECFDPACDRSFLSFQGMVDHAETVHTFDDLERLVRDAVREKYHVNGDYRAEPPVPSTFVWVNDLSVDWVVFTVEREKAVMYQAPYSISDSTVTLGSAVEVVRRTVYEPVDSNTGSSV